MEDAIAVEDLSKVFRSGRNHAVWALQNVTFRLAPGTLLLLTGNNGSGKTTLLKILATLILPTSGAAFINGYDVVRNSLAARRQVGICWSDDRAIYWRLTGEQNLMFFGTLYGLSKRQIRQRISQLKRHFRLDFLHRPVCQCSTGMRQRLILVRALLHDPSVLLLDEPTRSLDQEVIAALSEWLGAQRDSPKTVLLTTQRPEELRVGGRIGMLESGRLMPMGKAR